MIWQCLICDWRYDASTGLPAEGIEPGTDFEAIREDWCCPECGASKDDFVAQEVQA